MESGAQTSTAEAAPETGSGAGGLRWRLWALVPIVLIVAAVSIFASTGGSLVDLVGRNPPPPDELDVRRVEFKPGEIRIHVRNPQPDDLTVALVTVDDAIVPFELEGSSTLGRLASRTIVVPFDWVEDDPYVLGVTSSSGIQTSAEVAAAVESEGATPEGFLGYALIGFLVGVVPVALGLAWLPSLRRASPGWLAAFMALTAGLLAFLAIDALAEALELQAALPGALHGTGLVLVGVAASYLALTWISTRFSAGAGRRRDPALSGTALALLVAIGIGLHNLGEGLAIGSSFAFGELALGTFLIIGFMIHNVTEGLGIAAPMAEGGRVGIGRLGVLALVAGAPAIAGAWIGGFLANDVVGVLFFSIAVGAALQVVVEVGRFVHRRAPGGLGSGYVIGGFPRRDRDHVRHRPDRRVAGRQPSGDGEPAQAVEGVRDGCHVALQALVRRQEDLAEPPLRAAGVLPGPPTARSLPAPPTRTWLPEPPSIRSFPAPPRSVSLLRSRPSFVKEPPRSTSSPDPPSMTSLPSCPPTMSEHRRDDVVGTHLVADHLGLGEVVG
jgi:zinc transporter, ZIP family